VDFHTYEIMASQSNRSEILIRSNRGLKRNLDHAQIRDSSSTREEQEKLIAEYVQELTSDFVTEIDCGQIERKAQDLVVYFGPEEDLSYYGSGSTFFTAAVDEKYAYGIEKIQYSWNNDAECKKQFGLDS